MTTLPQRKLGSVPPSNGAANGKSELHILQLENLLLRDDDIFQTSLNSEDYLDSLAPIIKDAIKLNGLADLIQKLNSIVKKKDEELLELSVSSTDEINQSIDRIDRIHGEAEEVSSNLALVSDSLSLSVSTLINKKKMLIKSKETLAKINETNIVMNLCVQVLEITNKIHDLIKQKKYFNALKLIDELINIHVPKVENFSFAIKIYDSIPHLTKTIEDDCFSHLYNWIGMNTELRLTSLSNALYQNLFDLQDNWNRIKKSNSTLLPHKLNSPVELSLRDPLFNYDLFADPSNKIDMTVVYDAILVFLTLNQNETLSNLYHKEWVTKYNKVVKPITLAVDTAVSNECLFANLMELQEYLQKMAAFFILDKQANLATKFQLRTNLNSNDLWESYVTKLKPALMTFLHAKKLTRAEDLTDFKNIVGDFLQIMELYNFDITVLYEVLVVVFRDYFAPELVRGFRSNFLISIQSDHYMPLVVDQQDEYLSIVSLCWYPEDSYFAPPKLARDMPIAFPFSEDYVHYCFGIRQLLDDILKFTDQHYGYEVNDLNNIVLNEVFEKVLSDEKGVGIGADIHDFVSKNANNKEVISQSYTNLEYYLYSLHEIGKMINRRLRIHTGIGLHNKAENPGDGFTLRAVDHFSKLRKFSESTIFSMVDSKIRELLEFVEYDDWLPTEKNTEANFSIKDFSMFLENLFTSIFSNLPSSIRTLGLFRTYDFVSEHFLNILKNVEVYNRTSIENFDLDVRYIEESMRNLYLTHQLASNESGGNVALESTFTELRQCIDLLKLNNYEDFTKNPSYRMRNFDRIRYEDGLKLISKMQGYQVDDMADGSSILGASGLSTPRGASPANTSVDDGDLQSILLSATAAKFAKFSSRFKKNLE